MLTSAVLRKCSTAPAALLGFIVPCVGCQKLIGADFEEVEARPAPIECARTLPAEPPTVVEAGGGVSFAVVPSSIEMSEDATEDGTPEYQLSGFDIDDNCSAQEAPICLPYAWTGGVPSDGLGGEDNAVGKVLFEQERFLGAKAFTSELLSVRLTQGVHAPLGVIRVSDYVGLVDDDQVTVDWYVGHLPEVGGLLPAFDGTERWPIVESSVNGTATSEMGDPDVTDFPPAVTRDVNAYVSRFRLVARFDNLSISFANFNFPAQDVVLTGTIERDAATQDWTIVDALITGRSRADTLVEMLPVGAFETAGVSLCPGDANYDAVKQMVCSVADTVLEDQVEPTGTCGATSFGMRFETVAATLGPVFPDRVRPEPCPPDRDPADDTCRTSVADPIVLPPEVGP